MSNEEEEEGFSPRAGSTSEHSEELLELDAYGDSFDSQWMAGASERALKERAESIALKHLLMRDTSHSRMYWRQVMDDNELAGKMTVEEFKDAWSGVLDELPGDALSALCVRFGPMYMELYRAIVRVLNTQHNERNANYEIKQLWEQFAVRTLRTQCNPTCELDLDEMRSFLARKELEVGIIEAQLCRAAGLLEDLASEPLLTSRMFCGLLRQIGLPSAGPEVFGCMSRIALRCSLEREPDYCTLGCLLRYSVARESDRGQQGGEGGLSASRMVHSLLQPGAGQQHVLALLAGHAEEGKATLRAAAAAVAATFGDSVTVDFCEVMCRMWCREQYVNAAFVYSADVELFCCPAGYAVNVKTPLGGFRLQGRLRSVDTVRALYTALTNKLFVRLRATRVADSHLRIPSDIKVYGDPDRSAFVPASNDLLIALLPHDSTVWVFSEYVSGLLAETAEDEFERAFLTRRGAGHDKVAAVERKERDPKKEKKKRFRSPKDFLDELLSVGQPVVMPPPPAFFADEAAAHRWNIPTVASYLCEELELPQYKAAFARHEVNGHALICLDEDAIASKFDPADAMHVTKIAAHCALLREKVLESAALEMPRHLSDWDFGHVAGWLKYSCHCPCVALSALRKRVDGAALMEAPAPAAQGDASDEERGSAEGAFLQALQELVWGGGPPPEELAAASGALAEAVVAEHRRLAAAERRGAQPPAPPGGAESAMARRRRRGEEGRLEGVDEEGLGNNAGEEEEEEAAAAAVSVPVVVVDERANPLVQKKGERAAKKAAKKAEEAAAAAKGCEGEEFRRQITELQQLIEAQARSYEKLSAAADQLRLEKEQSDHDLSERAAEQRAQQALIEQLAAERDRAEHERQRAQQEKAAVANTLAVASNKFFNSLEQERARREEEMEQHRGLLERRRLEDLELASRAACIGPEAALAEGLTRAELKGTPGVAGAVSFAAGAGTKGLVGRIRLQGLGAAVVGAALPLWEDFLERYRYRSDDAAPSGDTRSVQQQLYSLWLQLGSRLFEDLLLARQQQPPPADLEMLVALETCCKRIIASQMPKDRAVAAASDRYIMSICFVYVLGCVRKILSRAGGTAETASVASALSSLREGSLAIQELSRENLRLIFSDTLGVAFPSFYVFDAVCQRVDVGRRGAICFYPDVVGSFGQLAPLYAQLVQPKGGGARAAQAVVLTLLSLASEHVVCYACATKKGASLEDVFLDLVAARVDSVPSFRTYAVDRKSDRPPEAYRGGEQVHLTQLVADVLFEMARPYLCSAPGSTARPAALLPRILSAGGAGRGDGDIASLEWLQQHARDACAAVARSLQLYGSGSSSACMETLAAFFLTFLSFRRASLLACAGRLLPAETRPYSRIRRKDALEKAAALEALVAHFAGEDEAREIAKNTSPQVLALFEASVAGATGLFLPETCRLPLVSAQCDAEYFLSQAAAMRKDPSCASSIAGSGSVLAQLVRRLRAGGQQKAAYAGMLSDVRSSLELHPYRSAAADPPQGVRSGKENSPSPQRPPPAGLSVATKAAPSQTVAEVNVVLHNQRVAALSTYLEYLNSRAHGKRGILEVLLTLYRAATALCDGEVHDVLAADGSAVRLSRVELVKKASEMQGAILDDMQRVPSVATQQLAQRVEKLRKMVEQKKVDDADRGIALYLEQISTMEQVLLQSNADAISITSKVVNKLR